MTKLYRLTARDESRSAAELATPPTVRAIQPRDIWHSPAELSALTARDAELTRTARQRRIDGMLSRIANEQRTDGILATIAIHNPRRR